MSTFTLTTATNDTVAGTNQDDVVTGTGADWQATDTINGGAGNDLLQITALSASQATADDSLFQHVSNLETLSLLGKFAETVKLGTFSDAAGIVELDGSGLAGNLAVDASGRVSGITIDAAKGANTLTGTVDNDTFRFTSAGLDKLDKVDGGGVGDADTIQITDKAALTDAAFLHVTNVERVALGGGARDYTGQKVTLGALSVAAGITEVDVLDSQGATLDATARATGMTLEGGAGNDVFKASKSGQDTFDGGNGDDSFQTGGVKFGAGDVIDGGAGRDEVRIMDSAAASIVDFDFQFDQNLETLAFNAPGKETVSLGFYATQSGIDTVDASKMTGGLNLTLDANMTNTLTVKLGTGVDHLSLGDAGAHIVALKSTSLTAADTMTGAVAKSDALELTDAVKLTDKYFLNLQGVTNFNYLELDGSAKGQSVVAGANFDKVMGSAGTSGIATVLATTAATTSSFIFDLSKSKLATTVLIAGGGGHDTFIAGQADTFFAGATATNDQGVADSFLFKSQWLDANDRVIGGKSTADELVILDDATAIVDADFTKVQKVEHLRLGAGAPNTSYTLTLDAKAQTAGIDWIDASHAGVNVTVNAQGMTSGSTFIAGAKNNIFNGGTGDDVFMIDAKSLNAGDKIDGGTSANGDTLQITSGGTISAAALANVQNVEHIRLSDKGNTLVMSDAVAMTGEVQFQTLDGYQLFGSEYVFTGKGKDTVDLSHVTGAAGGIDVIGSGGHDKYIGSVGVDTFIFQHASDLAGTQLNGGGGNDTLVLGSGTYTAAALKGVSHIEGVILTDTDPTADFNLTISNALMKTSDSHGFVVLTNQNLTGHITVDASGVTDPTASLTFFPSTVGTTVTLKGTAGADNFYFGENGGVLTLDANDTVAGNGGNDTIGLLTQFNGTVSLTDSDLDHVSGIETLGLITGANTTLAMDPDAVFEKAGISEINGFGSAGKLDIDALNYSAGLLVHAGQSTDTIKLGIGSDTIEFDNPGGGNQAQLTTGDVLDGRGGHDALLFVGNASIADAAFTNVSSMEEIDFKQGTFSVTLGAHSDATGIHTIDASQAGQLVLVDGTLATNALGITGSSHADILGGGSSADRITGGGGGDFMAGGGGSDTFVYQSAADSRQLAGNDISHVDSIGDFSSGDTIDLTTLHLGTVSAVTNLGTVASFATVDTGNFYNGHQVAAAYQVASNTTRIYVDTNHDGSFNLNQDIVINLVGNHLADATAASTYISS